MFAKAFLLAVTLIFATSAGALDACANGGIAGTTNAVATKDNLNILPGDLCGDYVGNGHASWTTCDGSTVVSVNPPDAGIAYCESSNIPPPEVPPPSTIAVIRSGCLRQRAVKLTGGDDHRSIKFLNYPTLHIYFYLPPGWSSSHNFLTLTEETFVGPVQLDQVKFPPY
ncbi:hypothetical protein K438DRAFT_1756672 [Mycena galopus ATCC 62051]|nr:hypothetical protein K438DRAFT_1756672 [Mycena galopus ATCC 62051]